MFITILAMVAVLSSFSGCAQRTEQSEGTQEIEVEEMTQDYEDANISIATGGTGGVYFPLGGALASIYNTHVPGVRATAESTGAALANLDLIRKGEVEVAFTQNDITYYAFTGTEMYAEEKEPFANLKGMAVLYPEIIQLVTLTNADVNTVKDLTGKRVAIGAQGSGTEANANHILEAHGLKQEDLAEVHPISFAQAVMQMRNGEVDAAFVTAGIPTAAIGEMATTMDIRIIPIASDRIRDLTSRYPFYVEVVIPAGTYAEQSEDITTTAVMAMLVVSSELPERLVYNMTQAIFEHRDYIVNTHDRGKDIMLETALIGMPVDLHPGAASFFEDHLNQ